MRGYLVPAPALWDGATDGVSATASAGDAATVLPSVSASMRHNAGDHMHNQYDTPHVWTQSRRKIALPKIYLCRAPAGAASTSVYLCRAPAGAASTSARKFALLEKRNS